MAAEVSSRGWPPHAVAARARSCYAVTSAVESSGVVTFDIKGVVATPALEGASGVSEERPRRKIFDGERSELRPSDPTVLRRNESGAPFRSVAIGASSGSRPLSSDSLRSNTGSDDEGDSADLAVGVKVEGASGALTFGGEGGGASLPFNSLHSVICSP